MIVLSFGAKEAGMDVVTFFSSSRVPANKCFDQCVDPPPS